jgi:hypothetical protein
VSSVVLVDGSLAMAWEPDPVPPQEERIEAVASAAPAAQPDRFRRAIPLSSPKGALACWRESDCGLSTTAEPVAGVRVRARPVSTVGLRIAPEFGGQTPRTAVRDHGRHSISEITPGGGGVRTHPGRGDMHYRGPSSLPWLTATIPSSMREV